MNLEDDGIQVFSFWRLWRNQYKKMNKDDRASFIEAIIDYAFDGIVPAQGSLSPVVDIAFEGAMHTINTNLKKILAGKKGGINKGKKSAIKQNESAIKQNKSALNDIDIDIDIDNRLKIKDIDRDIDVDGVCADAHDPTPKKTSSNFNPPTEEDVKGYLLEKGLSEGDAMLKSERFVSFYASKGWMVGKNKMKNWRAAMSGWLARDKEESHAKMQESAGLSDAVLYLSKVM